MTSLCDQLQIKRKLSTAFHPQTDGQIERMNRTLEEMLRHFVGPDQDDWDKYLSQCEFAHNNSYISGTDTTPFFLNYGYHPKIALISYSRGEDLPGSPAATRMNTSMQEALSSARQCLERARQRAAVNADKHRRDEQYQPGDLVLLSTRNIKFRGKKISKLMPKYIGPFKIKGKVGSVAYKLQLPDKYRLHPTFHVALLRRYQTDPRRVSENQPDDEIEGENYFKVERILDHQDRKKPGRSRAIRRYFLIRWEGYPPSEDSWEPEDNLRECEDALQEYYISRGLAH